MYTRGLTVPNTQVAEMKIKLQSLDKTQKAHLTRQADKAAAEFEGQRNLDNVCMVVDMVRLCVSVCR